jgi:hypothetical protein
MLTEGGEGSGIPSKKRKKTSISVDDLPSNWQSLSVSQLKSFCASHGLELSKKQSGSKEGIINQIEKLVSGGDEILRLTN